MGRAEISFKDAAVSSLTFTKTSYDPVQRQKRSEKMMVRRDASGWKLLPAKP